MILLKQEGVIDWQHKEDVQRQMRRAIKERLRTLGVTPDNIEAVTAKIMDVARARLKR
jgi:type I restriction enzyme, R subunit